MFLIKYFRKRKMLRIQREILESQDEQYFKELYYTCVNNTRYLRCQLSSLQMRKNAKGDNASETRKKRERIRAWIDYFTDKLAEETFYENLYKSKAGLS
jgi:hypothetical protein